MLSEKSVPGPKYKDPIVTVRVLDPLRVAGKEYAVGDTVTMLLSDAQFSANCIVPPRVQIL